MENILKPSMQIWNYFKGDITVLQIASALADRIGGYHISYSATQLLLDLDLITAKTHMPNKKGKEVLSHYLHREYHGAQCGLKVQVLSPKD